MSRYEVMAVSDAIQRGFAVENPDNNSDFYYVCVDTMLNRIVASDGGEPEDRNLYRDFAPLVDELNRIAETGIALDTLCVKCHHEADEHMSPAIDLGLPMDGDVCQMGACPCREYVSPSPASVGPTVEDTAHIEARRTFEMWDATNGERVPPRFETWIAGFDEGRAETEARYSRLESALEAAVEHMIWMTGGWNNPEPIDGETTARMREGIDRALAALKREGTPDA